MAGQVGFSWCRFGKGDNVSAPALHNELFDTLELAGAERPYITGLIDGGGKARQFDLLVAREQAYIDVLQHGFTWTGFALRSRRHIGKSFILKQSELLHLVEEQGTRLGVSFDGVHAMGKKDSGW